MSKVGDSLNVAVTAETGNFEAGMKKVRRESKKTEKSLFEIGGAGAKAAAVGGAAFSSLGAGISLATASAEGLEGALASASGSVIAAFGAGGPVAGAMAIAAVGVGTLLTGIDLFGRNAENAAKKAASAFQKIRGAQLSRIEQIRASRMKRDLGPRAERMGVSVDDLIAQQDLERDIRTEEGRLRAAQAAINLPGTLAANMETALSEGRIGVAGRIQSRMSQAVIEARQAQSTVTSTKRLLKELRSDLAFHVSGFPEAADGPGPSRMMGPRDSTVQFIGGGVRGTMSTGGRLGDAIGAALLKLDEIARNTADNTAKAAR